VIVDRKVIIRDPTERMIYAFVPAGDRGPWLRTLKKIRSASIFRAASKADR
jgi:hypothetical protein